MMFTARSDEACAFREELIVRGVNEFVIFVISLDRIGLPGRASAHQLFWKRSSAIQETEKAKKSKPEGTCFWDHRDNAGKGIQRKLRSVDLWCGDAPTGISMTPCSSQGITAPYRIGRIVSQKEQFVLQAAIWPSPCPYTFRRYERDTNRWNRIDFGAV